jgi:hypothetical protein
VEKCGQQASKGNHCKAIRCRSQPSLRSSQLFHVVPQMVHPHPYLPGRQSNSLANNHLFFHNILCLLLLKIGDRKCGSRPNTDLLAIYPACHVEENFHGSAHVIHASSRSRAFLKSMVIGISFALLTVRTLSAATKRSSQSCGVSTVSLRSEVH